MRVYRIRWRQGQPYVAIGDKYQAGDRKYWRVKEKGITSGQPTKGWEATIPAAFDREIALWAYGTLRRCDPVKPTKLEFVICRLRRLRTRLKRHGTRAYD